MVMINREMYQQIVTMAESDDFRACVQLSERQEEQAYAQELVLRFFLQDQYEGASTELPKEYGEYITDWMRVVADRQGPGTLPTNKFYDTMRLLRAALGDDSFRRYDTDQTKHLGPFSIASYEFITSGIASNLDEWQKASASQLREHVEKIWNDRAFRTNSGTGVSPRRRVPKLINESRAFFRR